MKNEKMGAYVHIPFCTQKCKYCSFTSFACLERKCEYLKALLKEIKYFYQGEVLNTLYFGGGTPSLLDGGDFEMLINSLKFTPEAEVTVEVNPCSLTPVLLKKLYNLGVNRLSVGAQSFDDEILKSIGRMHSALDVKNVVAQARSVGFENISIDLIYGLPGQDLKRWGNSLSEAIELGVEHISLYGLSISSGCYFFNNRPENLADEDLQADMYLLALDMLKDFEHYEVSNFARRGFLGRHNLGYWSLYPYFGFGAGASGYVGGRRYTNTCSLEDYIANPLKEKEYEVTDSLSEEIFLGFRKIEGVDTCYINKKYGIDFDEKYGDVIEKYPEHILKTQKGYRLSVSGILLSNVVLSEFL
ncbi:oxygen-independent coproporphyrinogen III oxidase [Candidatus Gastranaerophilus sp. (ex Termes propinquus)]|nr:oxygen-independent coproporphyrinogen III oxidase [Candidatus Gastranaerophilus sp. (ex Termes propinquus)]